MFLYSRNQIYLQAFILVTFFINPIFSSAETFPVVPINTILFTDTHEQINTRINGVVPSDTTKALWSTRGNLTSPWVWNTQSWTVNGSEPLDFSGASPWNSNGGYYKAGTLITPRHVIFADHYKIPNGSKILFVNPEGVVATRTLTDQIGNVGNDGGPTATDIAVGLLDSPLPSSYTHYPILSTSTWQAYLHDGYRHILDIENIIPVIILNQKDHANIASMNYLENLYKLKNLYHGLIQTTVTSPFWEPLIGGDSGNPIFAIIGGKLVLLSTNYFPSSGPNFSWYRDDIQGAIDTLGGGYMLSDLDLSGYDAYIVPTSDNIMSVNEGAQVGTVIGTIGIESNIKNAIPHFSFSENNSLDGAFSINSSTGEIIVASSTLINGQNGFPRKIGINVKNGGPNGVASYTTAVISLYSYPYFLSTSYNLTLDEFSANNSIVGVVSAGDYQNDQLIYTIESGNESGVFAINSSTGRLTVANSNMLNYQNNPEFELVVKVQELNTSELYSATTSVSILLNDLNIAFDNKSYSFSIDESVDTGQVVGQVSASILDNSFSSVYFNITGGNEDGIFSINSTTGVITVVDASKLNQNNTQHTLSVSVSENSESQTLDSVPVSIEVTALNRPIIGFLNPLIFVSEGTNISIPVKLSQAYSRDISISYYFTDNSAIGGLDFASTSGSITIVAGGVEGLIPVSILSNNIDGPDKSFKITLSDPNRVSLGLNKNHVVIIRNVKSIPSSVDSRSSGGGRSVPSNVTKLPVTPSLNLTETSTSQEINIDSPNYFIKLNSNFGLGKSGSDVTTLQNFLISQGITIPAGATGYFGPQTLSALIEFQQRNNILPATGYFGPKTQSFISTLNTKSVTTVSDVTIKNINVDRIKYLRDLKVDSQGSDVIALQNFLISQGITIPAGATGYFGPQTLSALIEFQQRNNILPATGYFGPKTRAMIDNL